jgi:hypothetical protein
MGLETIITFASAATATLVGVIAVLIKIPKRLKPNYFVHHWKQLQSFCKEKEQWPHALSQADALLDKALKKRKFKGKTMGERMVSAQRTFTDNDGAWFAHNLYKKVTADPDFKLREADVKDALMGFRQALRDMGALPNESNNK